MDEKEKDTGQGAPPPAPEEGPHASPEPAQEEHETEGAPGAKEPDAKPEPAGAPAKKPGKKRRHKPRHTQLVVPGDKAGKKKKKDEEKNARRADRMGRNTGGAAQPANALPAAQEGPDAPKPAGPQPEELPPNAVRLPEKAPKPKKKRLSPVRRKRRRRRIQALLVLLVFFGGILLYTSEAYRGIGVAAGTWMESLRIRLNPGDGFPVDFAVPGYLDAQSMGDGGLAALGKKDMAIVSSTGREVHRIQHGYVNPCMTAGRARVCVYDRGGHSFTVESRGKNVARGTTEDPIVFAAMSPGGRLALVTASRYGALLTVYDAAIDLARPDFTFTITRGEPFMLAFHSDNRHFALATLWASSNGALSTTLRFLRVDRDTEQAAPLDVEEAVPLHMQYMPGGKLLVLFNTFAALYDSSGQELSRYDYGGRQLLTLDVDGGHIALVFGSALQGNLQLVMLDAQLAETGRAEVAGERNPRVLAGKDGTLLLLGQEVLAFSNEGRLLDAMLVEHRPYDLVNGGQPLLLTARGLEPLAHLLVPPEDEPSSSGAANAGGSVPSALPPEPAVPGGSDAGDGPGDSGSGEEDPDDAGAGG